MAKDQKYAVIGCPLDKPTPMAAEPRSTHCEKYCFYWCIFIIMAGLLAVYFDGDPSFTVSSATVSSSNLSSSSPYHLFSDIDLTLSAQKPYKGDKTNYELVSATVFYGPNTISQTSYDGKRNETTMRVKVTTTVDGEEAKVGVVDSATAVTFNVRVVASIRCWNEASENLLVRVDCKNVMISFTNSLSAVGSLVGPLSRCRSGLVETVAVRD